MARSKTKTSIVVGTVIVLALVATTLIVFRHRIANGIMVAAGKRAVINHTATPIDLTADYAVQAPDLDQPHRSSYWYDLPWRFQVFDNVPLQIDGMMNLWGADNAKRGAVFPEQILGIAVNQKFETLYVYHCTFFSSPKNTPVYDLVFRYEDGSSATNQVLFGADILDFNSGPGKKITGPTGPNSRLAWVGASYKPNVKQPLRFFLTAINNPEPSLEVTSIDLFSCKSPSAACILAMTTGRSGLMK